MARGWESKSVEEQQAATAVRPELRQPLTAEQRAIRQQLEALQLSRKGLFINSRLRRTRAIGKYLKMPWLTWTPALHAWSKPLV
jgi:hypothetical protein